MSPFPLRPRCACRVLRPPVALVEGTQVFFRGVTREPFAPCEKTHISGGPVSLAVNLSGAQTRFHTGSDDFDVSDAGHGAIIGRLHRLGMAHGGGTRPC